MKFEFIRIKVDFKIVIISILINFWIIFSVYRDGYYIRDLGMYCNLQVMKIVFVVFVFIFYFSELVLFKMDKRVVVSEVDL